IYPLPVLSACPPRPPLFPYTTLFRSSDQFHKKVSPLLLFIVKRIHSYATTRPFSGSIKRCASAPSRAKSSRRGRLAPVLSHHLRSEEHTSELQSRENLVCRLLLEKKK